MIPEPYFLTNPEWYRTVPESDEIDDISDENETGDFESTSDRAYVLTEKAPPKAIESYEEFYRLMERNGSIDDDWIKRF